MAPDGIIRRCLAIVLSGCLLLAQGTLSQQSSSAASSPQDVREFCEGETVEAKCAEDEVIVMGAARYGRMRPGRCLSAESGNMGCNTDVLGLFDLWCSGRHQCDVRVSSIIDSIDEQDQPCSKDYRSYLEVSFSCVKVIRMPHEQCISMARAEVTQPSGYLASIVTEETRCGSFDTPWVLRMGHGQTIDIELYDFAAAATFGDDNDQGTALDGGLNKVCHVYAIIKEQKGMASQTVCRRSVRNLAYSFNSNQLEIRLVVSGNQDGHFLLKYTANGCPDPVQPAYGWVQRQDNRALMGCNASTDTWSVTCDGNQWKGDYVNCSHVSTTGERERPIIGLFTGSQWASIVIILAIAVTLGLIIFLFGLVFLRRRRNLQGRRGATDGERPLPPDMYSAHYRDAVGMPGYGTKPLSAMDCSNSENDYYRTWQLQRHPPGGRLMPSAGAHGSFASADDILERTQHAGGGAVCTNPHCGQRPYDTMVDHERRYPLDHIYESPKFDRKDVRLPPPPQNQTSNSTTASSTQYFELEPEDV